MRMGVGIVGCGEISAAYLRNASLFGTYEIKAAADRNLNKAEARAREFGIDGCDVEVLLRRADIDIILNLTPPTSHLPITMAALRAGKHVYSEKPMATSYADGLQIAREAGVRGLVVAGAPDTFLGASHQIARQFVDAGKIGRVTGGVAFFLSRGMEDSHPNPDFFFKKGGGPLFDVAPYYLTVLLELLGPVERVVAVSNLPNAKRLITAKGPKAGTWIDVEVPTSFWCILSFASGSQVLLGTSWDIQAHSLPHIELYGSEGTIRLADPDQFGGNVHIGGKTGWQTIGSMEQCFGGPADKFNDYRGLGLVDMVEAIREKREPRASIRRALHIVEVGDALSASAETGRFIELKSSYTRSKVFGNLRQAI